MYDYLVEHNPSTEVWALAVALMLLVLLLHLRAVTHKERHTTRLTKEAERATLHTYIEDALAVGVQDGSLSQEAVDKYLRPPWHKRLRKPSLPFTISKKGKTKKNIEGLIVRRKA